MHARLPLELKSAFGASFTLRPSVWLSVCLLLVMATSTSAAASDAGWERPEGSQILLCTNWADDTCSFVDIDAGVTLHTFSVGLKPYDVKIPQGSDYAYVTCSGEAHVAIVDIHSAAVIDAIEVGDDPRDIVITDDGTRAVVANSGSNSVSVVCLQSWTELYTVPVGAIPYGVALTASDDVDDGWTAVVSNWGEGTVTIVRLQDDFGEPIRTVPVGSLPYTVVIPPNTSVAYVTLFGEARVVPVTLSDNQARAEIAVGQSPWGITSSPDGTMAIVANYYSGSASVLALSSEPPFATTLTEIALTPEDGPSVAAKHAKFATASIAVIGNLSGNEVLVIDVDNESVIHQIPVGMAPYGLAMLPPQE